MWVLVITLMYTVDPEYLSHDRPIEAHLTINNLQRHVCEAGVEFFTKVVVENPPPFDVEMVSQRAECVWQDAS